MKPTICRDVIYRSRTGKYSVPAKINATVDTLFRPNVEAGYLDDLSSDTHVHLTVFTPGKPGRGPATPDFVDGSDKPVAPNVGGLYQEWNVKYWEPTEDFAATADGYAVQPAGTWTWPPRA